MIRTIFGPACAAVAIALLFGCVSRPSEGYVPFRDDATPEPEAQSTCRERAKFHDGEGLEWVDWNQYATCMEEHGYRKP